MDENAQQEKKESKISNTSAALMIATAVILDLVSIIPVAGQFLADVGSFVIFLLWFLVLGLPLVTPKKLVTTLLTYIIEFIPAISALPAITVGVIIIIVLTKAEEKTGIQLLGKKGVPNLGNLTKAGGAIQKTGAEVMKKNSATLNVARKIGPRPLPQMNDMLPSET